MKQTCLQYSDCLTNQELYKHCVGSQFDVVNKAISLATEQIRSSRGEDIETDNVAYETLAFLAEDTSLHN